MPYISVIVPVYNSEQTIERCVNSICNQTFSDIEIILVDDGSIDASGNLCDALASYDSRIIVIHKKNQGVSSARNCGIDIAKGEYLIFVDSDDYLPLHYCESMLAAKQQWGENTFIWSAFKVVSDNRRVAEEKISYSTDVFSVLCRKDVLKLSFRGLLNSPCNKLYSVKAIHDNNLYMDESISIAEDLLFNLHYLDALGNCNIVALNQLFYCYVRNGKESLDHGYRRDYYVIHKKVLQQLWEYCIRWQVSSSDIPLYYYRYWDYMQSAIRNIECSKSSFFKKIIENNRILINSKYQRCIRYKKNSIGRGTYMLMKSRCYIFVWIYTKIRSHIGK